MCEPADDKTLLFPIWMDKIYIRRFPDAIKEFVLSPVYIAMKFTSKFAPTPKKLLHGPYSLILI